MLVEHYLSSENIFRLPNNSPRLIEAYILLTIYFIYAITNSGLALFSSDTLTKEMKRIKDAINTMIPFDHQDLRLENCVKFLKIF